MSDGEDAGLDPKNPPRCPECGSGNPVLHHPVESHLTPGVTTLCKSPWHAQPSEAKPVATQPSAPVSLQDVISNLDNLVRNDLMDTVDAWGILVKHAGTKRQPREYVITAEQARRAFDHGDYGLSQQNLTAALERAAGRQTWVDHPGVPLRHHVHEDVDSRLASVEKRLAALDNRTENLHGELREWGRNHARTLDTIDNRFRDYLTDLHTWLSKPGVSEGPTSINPAPPAPPW